MCPRKNSKILNNKVNKKKEVKVLLKFILKKRKEINPQNRAKKAGIKNNENGIRNLKLLSKVNDIEIQYKLEKK